MSASSCSVGTGASLNVMMGEFVEASYQIFCGTSLEAPQLSTGVDVSSPVVGSVRNAEIVGVGVFVGPW